MQIFILAASLFTGIFTVHADPSDRRHSSQNSCEENRQSPQVVGTKEGLKTLAEKICTDLNTDGGDSTSCQNKIEECQTSTADYLWGKVERDSACETRADHYYCSECGLRRIQEEFTLKAKNTFGDAISNLCLRENGPREGVKRVCKGTHRIPTAG
jgi:hypothetical protein